MGQIDNKGFFIKDDGTIVRNGTPPKINEMKKKLISHSNNDSQTANDESSNIIIDNILPILCVIIAIGCFVFGAIHVYDVSGGSFFLTIVAAIISGVVGFYGALYLFACLIAIYEVFIKE